MKIAFNLQKTFIEHLLCARHTAGAGDVVRNHTWFLGWRGSQLSDGEDQKSNSCL